MISVENLQKSFTIHHLNKILPALQGISLDVPEGSFLGIVGKSGSGKSTILKSIYRTYESQAGKILFQSEAFGTIDLVQATPREVVYLRKHEIGYVSQFLNVMPRTTALELVEQSLLDLGVSKQEATLRAQEALKHFDIDEALWNSYPNMFSGGEKLRLNIACAVVKEPRLLLLDEPTASLDQSSKLKVREAIEKLKVNGTTLIGIFHDLEFMEGLCDSIFHMSKMQEKELV
ncbi:phosphonate C-P lyase system protein PhnL [Metasolibacillus meyeri]|uniref:Phosphonate C-P lyase system protein PhnL n=1 Tax=Metasolibacillus meyeri TaxID=1071052 RepID=A0AAW9NT00_9BACL|nr:phosphonate C-P lyase system protein PhnL [Metasolibacillus meyeri]MEC1177918.1 phosphonate C-P lyase system protein PhnL [Metasolibacillus meyeri]